MTIAEKIEMFRGKEAFVENISKAFETDYERSTVAFIKYEVFQLHAESSTYFEEYIVVTFYGGAKSVRNVNGNSNTANFRAIGSMIDGGYYDEVFNYERLPALGYKQVQLY